MSKLTIARTEPAAAQATAHAWLWILGAVIAAVTPYLPSLRGQFVSDDVGLIVNNPMAHSLAHLREAFTTNFLPPSFGDDVIYYRPLVTASYQANYTLAGPSPFWFHVTNLVLNTLVVLLVFALARRLTRSLPAAGIAAIAFAVSPGHAEAVGWISGRTDIMSALFMLGAFLAFLTGYERKGGVTWPWATSCAVLFFLALLSKENALVLPIIVAAYTYVKADRPSRKQLVTWTAALVVPFVVFMLLRRNAVNVTVVNHFTDLLGKRLLGVGIAYVAYLKMLFIPQVGCIAYDVFPLGMKYPPIALAAWLAPAGLVGLGVWARKRLPVISFGALWILISLLPVTNILPATSIVPSDRFAYLAGVGSSIILGWLAVRMYELKPAGLRLWPTISVTLTCWFMLYSAALATATAQPYMSNVMWARAIATINGRFCRSWSGYYFMQAGMFEEAAREYRAAITYAPGEQTDYFHLARANRLLGRSTEAVEVLLLAKSRFPDSARLETELGVSYAQSGCLGDARAAFRQATRLDPKSDGALRGLGRVELASGRHAESVAAFERAFAITPGNAKDRLKLAMAYNGCGMKQKAVAELRSVSSQHYDKDAARLARSELRKLTQ